MGKKTQKQQQKEVNKQKVENLKKKIKKVNDEFDKFWAKIVLEEGMVILPIVRFTMFGVVPSFEIFEATDGYRKKANEILKREPSKILVPKGSLKGLGS